MDLTRTVPIPLNPSPDLIWGLRLEDFPVIGAAVVFDLFTWHSGAAVSQRIGFMAVGSAAGALLAWARIEDRTLIGWMWVIATFYRRPRHYSAQAPDAARRHLNGRKCIWFR